MLCKREIDPPFLQIYPGDNNPHNVSQSPHSPAGLARQLTSRGIKQKIFRAEFRYVDQPIDREIVQLNKYPKFRYAGNDTGEPQADLFFHEFRRQLPRHLSPR